MLNFWLICKLWKQIYTYTQYHTLFAYLYSLGLVELGSEYFLEILLKRLIIPIMGHFTSSTHAIHLTIAHVILIVLLNFEFLEVIRVLQEFIGLLLLLLLFNDCLSHLALLRVRLWLQIGT